MQLNLARIRQFSLTLAVLAAMVVPSLASSAQAEKLAPGGGEAKRSVADVQPAEMGQLPSAMEPAEPASSLRSVVAPATKATPPATVSKPTSTNVISGVKNIPGDYATLAAAITDLNAQGVGAGGVTLNLLAGNPQTAPAGGYVIGGTGSLVLTTTSASNPVTIQGNGNTITASAALTVGSINDAIFKLIGADWVTITGFTMQENPANTISATAATNNMTEFGVALFYVTTSDGSQNNTIQGNTISLNRTYLNTFGIYSNTRHTATSVTTSFEVTSATGSNSNNKVYGNNISNVNYGIVFIGAGTTIAAIDTGNDIGGSSAATGNTITNWGGAGALSGYISLTGNNYCIFDNQQINDNVSFNTITSAAMTSAVTEGGILKNYSVGVPTGTFTTTINNNTVTVTDNPTATGGSIVAINNQGLTSLLAGATMSMNNNIVQNCVLGGSSVTTGSITGITNLSLPGTMNINGNSVLNHAITASSSTSGILNGISNSGAAGTLNMNNNVLRGFSSTATSGQPQGITNSGAVVTALNINNNQLGNSSGGFFSTSTVTSGSLFGISTSGGAATCALSIQGNDIRGITYNSSVTAAQNFYQNTAATLSQNISNNTFTNLNINTTGSVTFISNSVTAPTGGFKTVNGNSIATAFNKGGAGGTVTLYGDNASSVAGVVVNNNNNNFSNITVTGATTIAGWSNTDGGSPTKTIQGNTFSNWSGGSGTITALNLNFGSTTTTTVTSNTISNITGAGAVTGVVLGSSIGTASFSQNTINTLASTGAAAVQAITSAATTANIFKNKLYDLSGSNASSTVSGLLLSAGTTLNAYNNLIGDLRATVASATDVIRGISITSATTTSSLNVSYNTIYLNAASSGANFGTTGIFHTASATSTTANLTMRDNIVVNTSTPNGTGLTVAYRRSGTALNNFATTSNNNLFYAGAPGAGRLIFNDGTNSDQTLGAYKARVTPAEGASVTENPPFLSTSGASANFLHINPSVPTLIESGGSPVAGITDDFDSQSRDVTTPDIGADEFTGTLPYTITASAGAGGSITPSGAVGVANGGSKSFAISADACHTLADVLVDGVSVGAVSAYTFTNVTANHTIAASFNLINYTITASAGAGGSISPSGAVSVGCATNKAFAISPDACHTIADVLVDGVSVGAVSAYTFSNVTAAHTIAASFNLINYTITASAGAGGSISPSGAVSVGCATDQAFAISPDACHTIADVLVDGVSVGAVSAYTFTNVTAAHTIAASFNVINYTINATAASGGTISPSGGVSVNCGSNQAFAIAPGGCSSIADVLVDGVSVGAVSAYTFSNVTATHTISASFTTTSFSFTPVAGALPGTLTGVAYSQTIVASGGTGPYTYAITSGSLPAGLALSTGGVLSGTPTAAGTFNFDVTATDANNCTSPVSYSLVVGPNNVVTPVGGTVCITPAHPCLTVPVSISRTDVTGMRLFHVTFQLSPNLQLCGPAGSNVLEGTYLSAVSPTTTFLVLDNGGGSYTADGSINGLPCGATAATGNLFNIKVTSSGGSGTGSVTVTSVALRDCSNGHMSPANAGPAALITIDTAPVSVAAITTPQTVVELSPLTITPSVTLTSCATGPVTWSVSPALPSGALLNTSTGEITWTPACGTANTYGPFTLTATAASGDAGSSNPFQIIVSPKTYTIVASAGAGGSISPNGNVVANCGSNQAFAITANSCYSIADVLVDGSSVGTVSSYTFTNVQAGHTIAASFTLNSYTIVASAGAGGSISPSGNVSVNCGANQAFAITASACNSIADVLVDGVSVGAVGSYTFSNVTAGHTIAASFTLNSYTITASAGAGGSISPNGGVSVNCGANQAFAITASACHSIADVLVDGVSVGAVSNYTFSNVSANHTIAASFTLNSYTIVASAGAGGSISPSGNVAVNCGDDQAFAITANSCHSIADVLVDGVSVGAASSYTFTNVTAGHTIAASFTLNTYTIVASAGAGGAISPSGNVVVNCGANQPFAITANSCYAITDVLVDGVSVGAVGSYTFSNVTAGHTIAASFTLNSYTITASAGAGGSISPNGSVPVNCGADQAFSITPDGCHTIADVLVDGVSVGAVSSYTFSNVSANHTIAASFTLNSYTIVASAGANGSISPSGNVSVNCGANQPFAITPNTCYSVADVLVDGVSVGAVSNYTFSNVTAGHTIAASFVHVVATVPAPTAASAAQVLTGNPPGNRTGITITFTPPGGAASFKVYRAGFGQYPEYDDNGGAPPTAPTTYPPPAPWVLTSVTASGGIDLPPVRDYWYYVVYAFNSCGDASLASNRTTGTLGYHLGDVTDGFTLGLGDNLVGTPDISLLGAHYGITLAPNDPVNYLDVGPTTTHYVDGRPLTDNLVNFEDLALFAINYGQVSAPAGPAAAAPGGGSIAAPAATDELVIVSPDEVVVGTTLSIALRARGTGSVQAMSTKLSWDPAVVQPTGQTAGELLKQLNGVLMSPAPGTLDAAILGRGRTLTGKGELATITFEVLADGDPKIRIQSIDARGTHNEAMAMSSSRETLAPDLPKETALQMAMPNPFRDNVTLAFTVAQSSPVELTVFSVDGRRVRTLASGVRQPGFYRLVWDGRDDSGHPMAAGVFYARFVAGGSRFTRTITYLR